MPITLSSFQILGFAAQIQVDQNLWEAVRTHIQIQPDVLRTLDQLLTEAGQIFETRYVRSENFPLWTDRMNHLVHRDGMSLPSCRLRDESLATSVTSGIEALEEVSFFSYFFVGRPSSI